MPNSYSNRGEPPLDQLTNTVIDNPTNGQVLTYSGTDTVWKNQTPTGVVQDKIEEGNTSVECIDAGTGQVDIDVDATPIGKWNVANGLDLLTSKLAIAGAKGNAGDVLTSDGANVSWTAPAVSYSAGAWTPAFAGSAIAGAFTYTAQVGSYIRIGNLVYAQFRVSISNVGTAAAGYAYITGLPFNAVEYPAASYSHCRNFVNGDAPSWGYVQNATNYIQLMRYNANTIGNNCDTHVGGTTWGGVGASTADLQGSITYITT